MAKPSLLSTFYFENASKSDLIADILALTDRLKAAEAASAKLASLERKLESAISQRDSAVKRAHAATSRLSAIRKKHGDYPAQIKTAIIELICSGLSNDEITEKGYNRNTVRSIRSRIKCG